MEKIDETIENICSWINDRLNDSMMVEDAYATADMVTALADLVSARGKRSADPGTQSLEADA